MAVRKHRLTKLKAIESPNTSLWVQLTSEHNAEDNVEVAQIDLHDDLNDDFFKRSYELVHHLVPLNTFLAAKMKRFIDILARLHNRYVEELDISNKMKATVRGANEKLQLALTTTLTSEDMMSRLRESLANAWRVADAVQNREAMLQSHLIDYALREQKARQIYDAGTEQNRREVHLRSVVFRERDRLARELKEHQYRLEINRCYSESLQAMIEDQRSTIQKMQVRVKVIESESFKSEHKCRIHADSLTDKIVEQRKELESVTQENQELRMFEKKYAEATIKHDKLKKTIERYAHDNFSLSKLNRNLEDEILKNKGTIKNCIDENRFQQVEKEKIAQLYHGTLKDMKKKTEMHAMLNRRFRSLSKKNMELIEQERLLKHELTVNNKNLVIAAGKLDDVTRQKDEVERSREKVRGETRVLYDGMATLKHDMMVQRNRMGDLQLDLERANKSLDDKDLKIHQQTKEKNELISEANSLSKTIETLEDDMARKNEKLADLTEKFQQKHQDYLNVKKQMELIHSEKTMLQKSFEVCGYNRQNLQNVNTKLSFQINQLCSQLAMHEKEINSLKNQIDHLNNTVKRKQTEIHAKERQQHRMRTELFEMKKRNEQLQHTIEEDEKRFKKLSYSLDEVRKEKTLVGQQMVRRNGELRLQHEKLTMMQTALSRGTLQYNQRVEDIRLLKTEISNLHMTKECLQRAVAGTTDMRHEVVRLERQLNRERLHVTAFTEEMKHPYRIHRWRLIRGQDPNKFELIRKIQLLLKRNIRLSVQLVNTEQKVKDIQLLYDKLKKQLQYMPDPSIKARFWMQQRINQRQMRKVRAMKAELAINEIDLKSRDIIIQEFQQALREQQSPSERITAMLPVRKDLGDDYMDQIFQATSRSEPCHKDRQSS